MYWISLYLININFCYFLYFLLQLAHLFLINIHDSFTHVRRRMTKRDFNVPRFSKSLCCSGDIHGKSI